MKPDNVEYLPIWKADATAEERLSELAMIARKKPERFAHIVVIYEEILPTEDGEKYPSTVCRYVTNGVGSSGALGLIESAKYKLLRYMFGDE